MVVSRRENGWKPVTAFGNAIGCRFLAGRYEPGLLTNPGLETYTEIKLLIVSDAWPDRNVVLDAVKAGVPVVSLCDTNNQTNFVDLVIPCNNKGKKSLGLTFYLLAREYLKNRKTISNYEEFKPTPEEFTEE
jgi:small subunit ribosomal protein S2